jgi:hypothetical protein
MQLSLCMTTISYTIMVCLVLGQITQIPNTYSHYADPVMETLLVKMLPVMAQHTD